MTVPIYYLFLFPLMSYTLRISEMTSIELSWLCIPLAVYLGHRYRWQGVVTAAVGGLLLPFGLQMNSKYGAFPIDLDVYLIMIGAAVLTVKGWGRTRINAWLHSPYLNALALIILPIRVPGFPVTLGGDVVIYVGCYLLAVLYFVVFLQGTAGVSARMVIGGLVMATVVGFTIDAFGLPFSYDYARSSNLPAYFKVYYSLNDLNNFLAGAACYFVGRHYGRLINEGREPTESRTLLWLGTFALIGLWLSKTYWIPFLGGFLSFGSFYIVPVASLLLGMAFRSMGVGLAVIVALVGAFMGPLTKTGGVPFGEVLCAMVFGVMGTLLCDHATGQRTKWWKSSPCWLYAIAWLPVIAAIPLLYKEAFFYAQFLFIVALIVLVIATKLAIPLLRAWLLAFKEGESVEIWLSILTVIVLTWSIVSRIKEVVSKVDKGLESFNQILSFKVENLFAAQQIQLSYRGIDQESIIISLLLLLFFAFLLTIIVYLIRSYEKIMTDLHRLLHHSVALASKLLEKTQRRVAKKLTKLADKLEHGEWLLTPRMQKVLSLSANVAEQVRGLLFAMFFIGTFLIIELVPEFM